MVALTPIIKRGWSTGRDRALCWATSRDGVWSYARIDAPGTLWEVILIPAARTAPLLHPTLRSARDYTATYRDAALQGMSAIERDPQVREVIEGIRTGRLGMTLPDSRCGECGGMLTADAGGTLRHTAVCAECWRPGGDLPLVPCLRPGRHRWCDAPWRAECAHARCGAPVDVNHVCQRGFEDCCGCCGGE